MRKRNRFITNSRLRLLMQRHTDNEYLIDTCMYVSGAMVGFQCNNDEDFYKENRQFMKKLKSIPNEQIDNNPIWLDYHFAKVNGPRLIKLVKEDIRHMA